MRDLLEKLNQLVLNEAPIKPGEKKGISFTLKKLDKIGTDLKAYKNSLDLMKHSTMPPELKQEMDQLQSKLNGEIEKVQQAYEAAYAKANVNNRPVKMDNLFKALAKNCKDIIKVYKELNRNNFSREKFLFRGIRASDDALYGIPFDARKPKDSNRDLHELVNGTINSLGFEANRENAMFVTGDRSQASGYGNSLYIMFPVDGFKFTWSQTVKDLVLDSSKKIQLLDKNVVGKLRTMVKQAKQASENPDAFPIYDPDDLFYDGYNYDKNFQQIKSAISSGALPEEAEDLLNNILTDSSIQEHFEFTDSNLFGAILSEKEVYIKGAYYAVNYDHKDELFKFLAEIDTDSVELPENFGEVPEVLDVGDIVKILKGDYAGQLGTITYRYSTSYEVYINKESGDTTIPTTDVELYKLPDGSVPIYQKGEDILITDPKDRNYGQKATINYSYPNGKLEYMDSKETYHTIYKHQVAPYSEELEQQLLKDLETRPPTIELNDLVVVIDQDSEYYGQRGRVNYVYGTGTIEVRLTKNNDYIDFKPDQLVHLDKAPPELLKKEEGVFEIGDKVRITSGDYSNYIGKVNYVYLNGDKVDIDLIGLDKEVAIWTSEIQHYETPEEEKPTEPKKKDIDYGDTVKILKGPNTGKTGVVTYVYASFPEVSVTLQDEVTSQDYELSAIEKVQKPEQPAAQPAASGTFNVGDPVQVKEKTSQYYGKTGTITQTSNASGVVDVKFTDGGASLFYVSEIQPYEAPQEPEAEQSVDGISVGDLVKVINSESTFYDQVGEVIEVGKAAGGKPYVKFKTPDFPTGVKTFTDWVEKTEKPAEIKAGDTVRINEYTSTLNGQLGTVHSGPDKSGDFYIVLDNGKTTYAKPDKLTLVKSASPLKVGDKVKILPGANKSGETGTIAYAGKDGTYFDVEFPGGVQDEYPFSYLSKVEDEIDNLKWEPESEPQAPAKFEEGDRVEVVSQFPSLIGKTGKITQANSTMGFVSVWLDGNSSASSFPATALKKIDNQPTQEQDFNLGDIVQVSNPDLVSYGVKGKITDMDVNMLVVQDDQTKDVVFVKKSSVKKIG